MLKRNRDDFIIFIIVALLVEITLFTILKFTIDKYVLEGIFIGFDVLWLIFILFYFISYRRTFISLKKSKNPVKSIGEGLINKYYKNTKKVNINDLVKIKKTETLKKISWILLLILITSVSVILSIYV